MKIFRPGKLSLDVIEQDFIYNRCTTEATLYRLNGMSILLEHIIEETPPDTPEYEGLLRERQGIKNLQDMMMGLTGIELELPTAEQEVDWRIEGASFTSFGQWLMKWMMDRNTRFTGMVDGGENGEPVTLKGSFTYPETLGESRFLSMLTAFITKKNWKVVVN